MSERGTRYGGRDRPRYRKPSRPPVQLNASKMLLFLVMLSYFYGLGLGTAIIFHIVTNYPEYVIQAFLGMLTYIGGPVGIAIGFCAWKAKNENISKITCNGENDHED